MTINPDIFKRVAERYYGTLIQEEHGSVGVSVLRELLQSIRNIYKYVEPEHVAGVLTIFSTLTPNEYPIVRTNSRRITDIQLLAGIRSPSFTIQVLVNDEYLVWENLEPDPQELAQASVVYRYDNRLEFFYAKDKSVLVDKLVPESPSMFSVPTFTDLRNALDHYKETMAKRCACKVLERSWRDSKRIFLINGPESVMRDSLTQFLKTRMRSVEVRPEQIVDETHPVDIKVTWNFTNRLALIEIKWLGTPKYEDGHLGAMYTDYRAKEGARQLADYLDENMRQAPLHHTKGYLVVIDGRRAGLRETTTTITATLGLEYQLREVNYDPKYHEIRTDFEEPIRMFVEPICA